MIIRYKNGSYVETSIENGVLWIEYIVSNKKGDGSKLIERVKTYARKLGKKIHLFAIPQNNQPQAELNAFYFKNGFELHPDDCDYRFFRY